MEESDRRWLDRIIADSFKEPFYGKIEVNIQDNKIVTINVTKGHKRVAKK